MQMGGVASLVWTAAQADGKSGLPVLPSAIQFASLLLVWRKSESPNGEWACFAPKHVRDAGCVDGKPRFRPVPDGCTHFAVSGTPQVRFKINQAVADEATAAFKGGDDEIVAYLHRKF